MHICLHCYKFNAEGCSATSCNYRHELVSPAELTKLKNKIDKNAKSMKSSSSSSSAAAPPVLFQGGFAKGSDKKPYCFKCFSKDHLIFECPLKKQINEYINKLTGASQDLTTRTAAMVSSIPAYYTFVHG